MSRPILYSIDESPPCRAVLLTAEAIGLDLEIRRTDLFDEEYMVKEFSKVNPQHTIPTLQDDGEILWDSHAIICYLVGKYAKDDSLYPKDLKKRAVIDQRLHFDSGLLFALFRNALRPIIFGNEKRVPAEKLKLIHDAYNFLNKFLEGQKWLSGDNYTLADISCVSSLSSMDGLVPIASYPNVVRWLKTCEKELPGYAKANAPGNNALHDAIKAKLS